MRIRRGVQWVSGHEVVVEPKTDLSARELVLPRFAVLRLRLIRHGGSGSLSAAESRAGGPPLQAMVP